MQIGQEKKRKKKLAKNWQAEHATVGLAEVLKDGR